MEEAEGWRYEENVRPPRKKGPGVLGGARDSSLRYCLCAELLARTKVSFPRIVTLIDSHFLTSKLVLDLIITCLMDSVIYRDLKPDNIGFDVRGDVKIFDLGLAKEVDPKTKLEDGTYNLTADTGSLRYMAPEGKKHLRSIWFGDTSQP